MLPRAEGSAKREHTKGGLAAAMGDDEILLRVYEAEALVRGV